MRLPKKNILLKSTATFRRTSKQQRRLRSGRLDTRKTRRGLTQKQGEEGVSGRMEQLILSNAVSISGKLRPEKCPLA